MACFVAPMAAAIVTTVIRKKTPARLRLDWLAMMLWASVAALIVDHAISGELSMYPPFLTALKNPAATEVLIREIAVTGTLMTAAVLAFWAILVAVSAHARRAKPVSEPATDTPAR